MNDVVIVGGGSVGLFLGARLAQLGVEVVVLERGAAPARHTRAIGIHPPSLERMQQLGVAEALVGAGVCVRRGLAVGDRGPLGELSFETCPGPFAFVLSIPQYRTEAVLEERLRELAPDALRRGPEVIQVEQGADSVGVRWRSADGEGRLQARVVVGCDGGRSLVRTAAGIRWEGATYPDSFVMADLDDTTPYGSDAVLFLASDGLVECFPLPGGIRRWVVWTSDDGDHLATLVARVRERCGIDLGGVDHHMVSRFGVHRYLASRFASGRLALAGDSAHLMSPMGGQGMNVGWMDAWDLAEVCRDGPDVAALDRYTARSRPRAARAIRRADRNMRLGRGGWWTAARDVAISAVLRSPWRPALARLFTMRGL